MPPPSNFQKVKDWMSIAAQEVRDKPTLGFKREEKVLRRKLIREEYQELLGALLNDHDLVEIADGLADVLYVVYGTAATYGIDMDHIFDIVHENNMTKFAICDTCSGAGWVPNPVSGLFVRKDGKLYDRCHHCNGKGRKVLLREDGKVMKHPDWQPPDLASALGRRD